MGTEPNKPNKLFDMDVVETSLVDHPAHLVEGWVVMKSANKDHIDGLFGPQSTTKGTVVAEDQSKTPTVEDLTKSLAAANDTIADLQKQLAAKNEAKDEAEEMVKALPPAVQEMLKARDAELAELRKQQAADRAAFLKAEELRADEKAAAEVRGMFKSIAVDADKLGPALRRLPEEVAEEVRKALRAADEQAHQSELFKATGSDSDALGNAASLTKIEAAVAEVLKAEPGLSKPAAMAKAVEKDPSLYTEYMQELNTKTVN